MITGGLLKGIGIAATVVGVGATVIGDWAKDKQNEQIIKEEVNSAVDRALGKKEEDDEESK